MHKTIIELEEALTENINKNDKKKKCYIEKECILNKSTCIHLYGDQECKKSNEKDNNHDMQIL